MVKQNRPLTALHRKLWRDFGRSAMQFVAIMLLCALGTWVFSGLDGTWRMIDLSAETYFTNANLSDFWVNVPSMDKGDLDTIRNMQGVQTAQARYSAELDVSGMGDDVSLQVHANQDTPVVNVPLLLSGQTLQSTDRRGCLLDREFAGAHGLSVGDTIKLTVQGNDIPFVIRGIVLSAEHVILSKDIMPDPIHYGYAFINSDAIQTLPVNEVVVKLQPGADGGAVEAQIQGLLPQALIVTQKTHASTQRTRVDVTMFRNLTLVFPLLAFAVAMLIVMSTLTRMIENQRTQMGTLKALGYNNRQIRRHYLAYAFVPSMIGSFFGLFVGRYTLPDMLYAMEAAHYVLPQKLRPPISLAAWGMTALMVLLSVLMCLYTYRKQEKEVTAALLRPKPPRSGSRIVLEKWTALWRRFTFNQKIVVRNIARNKGRAFVAMVGLLCCNMLIICAMGLQDSIRTSVGNYYTGTVGYDLRVDLDSGGGTLASYRNRLDAERVEGVMEKSISLRYGDASRTVLLDVLSPDQQLLRLNADFTAPHLPENGIAISRKLADVTGLTVGDGVTMWLPGDNDSVAFTVEAVYETSIGQTAFLSSDVWNSLHKGEFRPTALLLKNPTALCRHQLAEMDEVTVFKDPVEQNRQTMTLMDSTTAIFSLMYAAALGLAFVVSYNMGLINFTERTRDYATLKVLGYHQKEIRRLMMQENNLITLFGAGLGVLPGYWLTQVVLDTVRSENNTFTAYITPQTFLLATLITCLFSILIERLLTRKVPSINMVEALKSVE